jgi:hypothetical protein
VQKLYETDKPRRKSFCEWFLAEVEDHPTLNDSCFWSDECHVWLDGYVNSQNSRCWAKKNPHVHVERSLHPQRLTVWAAVSRYHLIGPVFIDGIVDGQIYRDLISNQFIPKLREANVNLQESWFMQDSATPHTAQETLRLLRSHFGERLITKPLWPPHSPDLTPCDFWLWGYLKERVYRAPRPTDLVQLRERIISVFNDIQRNVEILQPVFDNIHTRAVACILAKGDHLNVAC